MSQVMLNRLGPLWVSLAQSAQRSGCANSEDLRSFRMRTSSEGLPYLTDGLAGLGRTFLLGIRKGFLVREDFAAVRFELKEDSTLPVFLYDAWSKVFTDDGLGIGATYELHDGVRTLTSWDPPITAEVAVRSLRQLTTVFSKLQLPHSADRVQETANRFIANEEFLARFKGVLWNTQYANETFFPYKGETKQRLTDVLLRARRLLHKVLCNVSPLGIEPRHGSGASACRTRPWERYSRILFDPEINTLWPYLEYTTAGRDHTDQVLSASFITDGYPKIARGVFVPKDYRGPRFISCEPATSMYYQQGLMTLLSGHLEQHPETSGFVNFTNQRINQVLAQKGSVSRDLATLDLSDASDRLSWDLIILLWPEHWLRALRAVRSKVTEIVIPERGTIRVPLRKHAPMGSATCFPVMALTIWALITAAQFSHPRAKRKREGPWIYGDDIICASRDAHVVCDLLESVGLKVNRDKSFYGPTPFRESCGKEFWNGFDTTPIYCRYNPTCDDTAIASLCSFANNYVRSRGTCETDDTTMLVHQLTGAPIIGIRDESKHHSEFGSDAAFLPGLYREVFGTDERGYSGEKPGPHLLLGPMYLCQRTTMHRRWHKGRDGTSYQKWEYRLRQCKPISTPVEPVGWGYVLRSLLIGGDLGFASQTPLAKRTRYKYGWVSVDW